MSNFTWPAILSFVVFVLNSLSQQVFVPDPVKPVLIWASAVIAFGSTIFFGAKTQAIRGLAVKIRSMGK